MFKQIEKSKDNVESEWFRWCYTNTITNILLWFIGWFLDFNHVDKGGHLKNLCFQQIKDIFARDGAMNLILGRQKKKSLCTKCNLKVANVKFYKFKNIKVNFEKNLQTPDLCIYSGEIVKWHYVLKFLVS